MRPHEVKKVVSSRPATDDAGVKINRLTGFARDSISQVNHEGEFQRAWADPNNMRFELPPVDVNGVLAEHYRTSEALTFTRSMLWDMEVRKAWRPDRYIRSVVRQDSARAWGRRSAADGTETFVRSSHQRLWLEPAQYGEEAHAAVSQLHPADRVALGDLLRTLTASLTPTPRQEQST